MELKKYSFAAALVLAVAMLIPGRSAGQGKDEALETIGAATGLAVYNTYIAIGAIADGYADEGYEADYVNQLMDEQINGMESMITQMHDLQTSGFITSADDDAYIEDLVAVMGYLKDEATGLKKIVDGGDSQLYDESRDKAWDGISDLLGLENE